MVEQSRGCDLVLVTGDFNTKPDTHCLQYNLLVKCLGLQVMEVVAFVMVPC